MKIIFTKTNFAKKQEFLLETNVVEKNGGYLVVKKTLEKNIATQKHLEVIAALNEKIAANIKSKSIKIPKLIKTEKKQIFFEYVSQPTLAQLVENSFYNGQPEVSNTYIQLFKQVVEEMGYLNKVKKFPEKLALITNAAQIPKQFSLNKLVDLSLDNILFDENKKQVYLLDQEWMVADELPTAYIYQQSIVNLSHMQRDFIWRIASEKFPIVEVAKGLFIPKSWLEILELKPDDLKKAHRLYRQFHQQTQNLVIVPEIEFYDQPKVFDRPLEVNFLSQYEKEVDNQFQNFNSGWPRMNLPELRANLDQARNDLEKIQSAKVYKVWQKAVSIRKKLKK